MDKQKFAIFVEKLHKLAKTNENDAALSRWLGRKSNYIATCKGRGTIDWDALFAKCDPLTVASLLKPTDPPLPATISPQPDPQVPQNKPEAVKEGSQGLEDRIKALEAELNVEKGRRIQLEDIVEKYFGQLKMTCNKNLKPERVSQPSES